MQSRVVDFTNKRKILLTDLLIAGMCYYKVIPSSSKTNINLKILNPLNTFIDRNTESPYHKDSSRSVTREYMTVDQILAKYGDILTLDDLKDLESKTDTSYDTSSYSYLSAYDTINDPMGSDGILGGYEAQLSPLFDRNTSKNFRLHPVYEVE